MIEFLLKIFLVQPALAQAGAVKNKALETGQMSTDAVDQLVTVIWDKIDNWIAALFVVIFSFFLAKMIQNAVVNKISEHIDEENQEVLTLAGRATNIAVLAIGVTIALKIAGIDITTIVAAMGLGVGFALQDLIANFIAGVMILVSKQFNIGDYIMVNNTIGQIKEIQSRCTIMQALDGTKIIVPNKDLFVNQVTSFTTNPFRRIDVNIGVEYKTDLKKALSVSLKIMQDNPNILKQPPPVVLMDSFGDSAINLILRFWVESRSNWLGIKSEMIILAKKALDEAGIGIPFPIRTIVFSKEEREISKAMEESGMVPKMNFDPQKIVDAVMPKADLNVETPFMASSRNTQMASSPKNTIKKDKTPPDEGAVFLNNIVK